MTSKQSRREHLKAVADLYSVLDGFQISSTEFVLALEETAEMMSSQRAHWGSRSAEEAMLHTWQLLADNLQCVTRGHIKRGG